MRPLLVLLLYLHTKCLAMELTTGYSLSWSTQEDLLQLEMEFDSTIGQWFGFGISPTGMMNGADIVTVRIAGESILVEDRKGLHHVEPSVDESQSWTVRSQSVEGSIVRLSIIRLLDCTTCVEDLSVPSGQTSFIWAYGNVVGNSLVQHVKKGIESGVVLRIIQVTQPPVMHTLHSNLPSYDHFLVLQPELEMYWRVSGDYIHLGIKFESKYTWAGIGIAEPMAGSMPGADFVICRFSSTWLVEDRFTLEFSQPILDENQDWVTEGIINQNGYIHASVRRKLQTNDGQDRDILPGRVTILHALGSGDGFLKHHSGKRRLTSVIFKEQVTELSQSDKEETVAVHMGAARLRNDNPTTYICKSFRPESLFNGEDAWITGFEFVSDVPNTHHLLIHSCDWEYIPAGFRKNRFQTYEHESLECDSPFGDVTGGCGQAVWIWTVGARPQPLPREAGFLVSNTKSHGIKSFIVEIHYDNPSLEQNIIDNSTVIFHYTREKRKHDMGMITFGDPSVSAPPIMPGGNQHFQFTCTKGCSKQWPHSIHVVGTTLHMHQLGKSATSILHRKNGDVEILGKSEYYSFENQEIVPTDVVINPGDVINVHCVLRNDGSKPVPFGIGSDNEMCMHFVWYYPALADEDTGFVHNFCGYTKRKLEYPFINGSMCGMDIASSHTDYSDCNPPPKFIDDEACYEVQWGKPGPIPLHKCKLVANATQCFRESVRFGNSPGDFRWTEAIPALKMFPSSSNQISSIALEIMTLLLFVLFW